LRYFEVFFSNKLHKVGYLKTLSNLQRLLEIEGAKITGINEGRDAAFSRYS
jgi:hypothetical protein